MEILTVSAERITEIDGSVTVTGYLGKDYFISNGQSGVELDRSIRERIQALRIGSGKETQPWCCNITYTDFQDDKED